MYNAQLEKLIEMALMDGELTEKEKQILFKKAEAEGIDLDEFEMVLNARLYEKKQILQQSNQNSTKPKSDKFGVVKKCPSCGANVQSYSTICDECGYEFSGVKANETIENLSKKLEEIRYRIQEKPYKNFLTQNIEKEQREKEITDLQKDLIKNFAIPNTREDILDLLHFISPKLKKGIFTDDVSMAWRVKFYEIIEKAKFAFKNDSKMLTQISEYERKHSTSKLSKVITLNKEAKQYLLAGLIFLALMGFVFIMSISQSNDETKEKERLEQIVNQVNSAIDDKNYEKALILAAQLKWEGKDGNERLTTKMWDEKRESIINTINELKNK